MMDCVRADKWLWATRFFKTRSLAAEACGLGKVRRGGHPLKAASALHAGDLLEIPFPEGPGARLIFVNVLISQRVSAPEAQACYEERTPDSVLDHLRQWLAVKCEASKGRPTKRNRREIDKIHGFLDP